MRAYFVLIAFSILFIINQCLAYTVTIAPNDKECFFEDLHHDDKMTITFQVGDGGNMDIDFTVILDWPCRFHKDIFSFLN